MSPSVSNFSKWNPVTTYRYYKPVEFGPLSREGAER